MCEKLPERHESERRILIHHDDAYEFFISVTTVSEDDNGNIKCPVSNFLISKNNSEIVISKDEAKSLSKALNQLLNN
jgi:hypothetical protein